MNCLGFLKKIKDKFNEFLAAEPSSTKTITNIKVTEPEILFLKYCDGKKTDLSKFAQSFSYNYGLKYPQTIRKLFSVGYLSYAPTDIILKSYKTTELKEFLKKHSLTVSGKKADLIERIISNCSEEAILNRFTDKVYSVTDIGKEEITKVEKAIEERRRVFLFALFEAVKTKNYNKTFELVGTKDETKYSFALPYDKKSIVRDIDLIHMYLNRESRTSDDDFACAIYAYMLHSHVENADELTALGYNVTSQMLNRDFSMLTSLRNIDDFKTAGFKKYTIATCKDAAVCPKCRSLHGKTFFVSNAKPGITAPPFCEDCRCIMLAQHDDDRFNVPLKPVDWNKIDRDTEKLLNK